MTNCHDKSDVLKEVKSLGNYLFYASEKLRDDKEVIYAAAKKGYIPRR